VKLTARQVAQRVLQRVEEGAYVNLALDGECARGQLAANDRALATTLVYGVLKGQARLDFALDAYAARGIDKLDPPTLDLLRMGALQLLELRTPAHAAIDETVEALKRLRGPKLAGFANALLRKIATQGMPTLPTTPIALGISIATGAPLWIVDAAIARLGEAEASALLTAEAQPAPMWVRVNPRRPDPTLAERLAATPSPLLPGALRLRGAGLFDAPDYVEGRVSVQDLGAQLVGALLDPQPGERVLDACAGVGGKSTQLAERMDDRGVVDALDVSSRKLELGADHAHRLGLTIVHGKTIDLRTAKLELYDRVLLDAPCSGLGVARRHPEVRLRRGNSELGQLVVLQAELLESVARAVKPGGVLVYAVCTYTDEEGPQQIARFLAAHPDFERDASAPIPSSLQGRGAVGELRTWPHLDDTDAFFAARLRRTR
jgi:16S rRNA (cytosine967-C5)-methyltransferase